MAAAGDEAGARVLRTHSESVAGPADPRSIDAP
jgi:hypothetical protein